MKKISNLFAVTFMSLVLIGCDLIPPFYALVRGHTHNNKGNYSKAIPYYETAIEGFSKDSELEDLEYDTRFIYAEMLLEHAKEDNPEFIEPARTHLESVLNYIDTTKDNDFDVSKGLALSTMAHTYHVESLFVEDDDEYFLVLESAYSIYLESTEELESAKEWHNLSITAYNIGEVADWYGDIDEAINWMSRAVQLDKEHGFDEDLIQDQTYLDDLQARKLEVLKTEHQ